MQTRWEHGVWVWVCCQQLSSSVLQDNLCAGDGTSAQMFCVLSCRVYGLLSLGRYVSPLPMPRKNHQLVMTGMYSEWRAKLDTLQSAASPCCSSLMHKGVGCEQAPVEQGHQHVHFAAVAVLVEAMAACHITHAC